MEQFTKQEVIDAIEWAQNQGWVISSETGWGQINIPGDNPQCCPMTALYMKQCGEPEINEAEDHPVYADGEILGESIVDFLFNKYSEDFVSAFLRGFDDVPPMNDRENGYNLGQEIRDYLGLEK